MSNQNYKRKRFSLLNLSIAKRLPILIFTLLFIVITSLTVISYLGVRQSSLDVGRERLKSLSDQFSALFQISTQRVIALTVNAANQNVVKNFISEPGNEKHSSRLINDASIKFESDTLNISAEIWSLQKELLYTTNSAFSPPADILPFLNKSENEKQSITGSLYSRNDSIIYPIISIVNIKEKPAGYFVRWRRILSSSEAIEQISELLGRDAHIYVGNKDGSLWTNLMQVIPNPVPVDVQMGIMEYSNDAGGILSAASPIEGTDWIFIIELSKESILDTANRFLQFIIIIGLIMLAAGSVLAVIMSRNITRPLNNLTAATSDIASGNYSASVELNRNDELGKLADSFNTMVGKVRYSQQELEKKVEMRTAQLKEANLELADLNKKLQELDEIKTSFFTNVSHELRTPLALILGPAEKLLSENEISEKYSGQIKVIQQNARVLLKHVNNLLDLSKLEAGKLQMNYVEFDLSLTIKVISSYFEVLANEQDINFVIDVPESLAVQADPEKIERILMNLLSNAFKYTDRDGNIKCNLVKEDGKALFKIQDSGPGIDPAMLHSIFDRYQQGAKGLKRNIGSTGLGLSIVKEFIELHEGEIEASNAPDRGAIFTFSIPVTAPAGSDISADNMKEDSIFDKELMTALARKDVKLTSVVEESGAKKKGASILIVEDNIELNNFIAEILKESYNIYTAFNGEEGYEKAKANKPDLILTDVMMPKMGGDELLLKLKSTPELLSIPVILLTAKADEDLKINLLKKGAHDFLNKPFAIEELKARINNIIKTKISKDILQKELKNHSDDITVLVEEVMDKKRIVETSLQEKNILLKEIHHRVKNNLQIVLSLLNLQSSSITNPETLEIFRECRNRIISMSLIHERLYKSKDFTNINFNDYIRELISYLLSSYKISSIKINTRIDVLDIPVGIDPAISLGLIITEVVTNSLKYAFEGRQEGEIFISNVKNEDDRFLLTIGDNGVGLPENFNLEKIETLGLMLVDSLIMQMNGTLEIDGSRGTKIKINMPLKKPEQKFEEEVF